MIPQFNFDNHLTTGFRRAIIIDGLLNDLIGYDGGTPLAQKA